MQNVQAHVQAKEGGVILVLNNHSQSFFQLRLQANCEIIAESAELYLEPGQSTRLPMTVQDNFKMRVKYIEYKEKKQILELWNVLRKQKCINSICFEIDIHQPRIINPALPVLSMALHSNRSASRQQLQARLDQVNNQQQSIQRQRQLLYDKMADQAREAPSWEWAKLTLLLIISMLVGYLGNKLVKGLQQSEVQQPPDL